MKTHPLTIFLLIITCFLLASCRHHTTVTVPAFYYWKSSDYSLRDAEEQRIKDLGIKKLYIKFFEVENHPVFGTAPYAKTDFRIYAHYDSEDTLLNKSMAALQVVPVVFIKNEVFTNASKGKLDTLADNLTYLCNKYYTGRVRNQYIESDYSALPRKAFSEIQIDCDWTESTKDNYFYLLKALRRFLAKEAVISCTLRLYPYKYPAKMGVPPVNRATLMCYNLTNPLRSGKNGSIQNNEELKKYLKGAAPYPVHLDVALPVFSWLQHYQNNQFVGIINPAEHTNIEHNLKHMKDLWYDVQTDMQLGNHYVRIGDKLKVDSVSNTETLRTVELLKQYVPFSDTTVVTLFHLDETNLKHYSNEMLHSFFTDFSR